jgi:hypothetical protein
MTTERCAFCDALTGRPRRIDVPLTLRRIEMSDGRSTRSFRYECQDCGTRWTFLRDRGWKRVPELADLWHGARLWVKQRMALVHEKRH